MVGRRFVRRRGRDHGRSDRGRLSGTPASSSRAGLSDDDAPGITTYSILGADYGYELLWVLNLATLALILFHELGARMGVVTGQGLTGLMRERYGVRLAAVGVLALLVANIGTTCEFAGVAASLDLAAHGLLVPSVPTMQAGLLAITATVGTTLAPGGSRSSSPMRPTRSSRSRTCATKMSSPVR